MKKEFFLLSLLVALGLGACTSTSSKDESFAVHENNRVRIGLILTAEPVGELSVKVAELSVQDLKKDALGFNLDLVTKRVKSPAEAAQAVEDLADAGIRLVAGIDSSQEAAAAIKIAEDRNVILLSHSVTSPTLSIANDNLFSLAPTDIHQASLMARVMAHDGIRCAYSLARRDIWGADLAQNLTDALATENIPLNYAYNFSTDIDPKDPSKHFREVLKLMQGELSADARACGGPAKMGLHIGAFSEIVPLLKAAATFDEGDANHWLSSIRWYGSDGFVALPALAHDSAAATFARKVKLEAPSYTVPPTKEHIESFLRWFCRATPLGEGLTLYTGGLYDAIGLLARTAKNVGNKSVNISALRQALLDEAAKSTGVSGPLQLTAAGDRAQPYFDLFGIDEEGAAGNPQRFWNLTRVSCSIERPVAEVCLSEGGVSPADIAAFCASQGK